MVCHPFPILEITDGTTRVDLVGRNICVEDWVPSIPGPKGGGVWQSSPLSDGRQLADWLWENWIDTFTIHISSSDNQDDTILVLQELHRLLVKAVQYWTTAWQNEPVWLKAKATYETNARYAIVKGWLTPQGSNPFGPLFVQNALINSFQLVVEHSAWQSTVPGEGDCVQISGYQGWCFPWHLEFNGADAGTSNILVADNAVIQDLPASTSDFTAEAWIRADGWGENNSGYIFFKAGAGYTGWWLRLANLTGIDFYADFDTTDMLARSGTDDFTPDGEWHHVAVTCENPTGAAATPRMWIDGVEVSYLTQNIGVTNYVGDTGDDLYIGNDQGIIGTFDGGIGWCRISTGLLYTEDFSPPPRCTIPEVATATIGLWIGEGSDGTTIDNREGTAAIDGTQTACTFDCECPIDAMGWMEICNPPFLLFDGATSNVNCGSNGAIDDMPGADFTVEAWVRPDDYGEGNAGVIFSKDNGAGAGWRLHISSANGLCAYAFYDVTSAESQSGLDDFWADRDWHHVAATWDYSIDTWRLWVDGEEVTYTLQTAGANNYQADTDFDLRIGRSSTGANSYWDGAIGWCRVSDTIRYVAAFDPPPRCTLPGIDANTVAQWIGVEDEGATIENQEGTAALDGTQVGCEFDCDCVDEDFDTCEEEIYIANKHNQAQLTHIYVSDAGAFGPNLLQHGWLPYDLLPAVPAVGDIVYFGIDTATPDSGPFCSLVFDIETAIVDVTGITWEYWQGAPTSAWSALTVQDNTDADGAMTGVAFDTEGVNSVHWRHPTSAVNGDWDETAVNGVTGFWVRARVTGIGGAPTAPVQQDRHPYSILWPYVGIDASRVGGDIPALARTLLTNQAGGNAPIGLIQTDAIMGLRSVDRGNDFSAYINLAQEQNPDGITVTTPGAQSAFSTDVSAAVGECVLFTAGGVVALSQQIVITFSQAASEQYYGKYRAFLRVDQLTGAAGDITVALITHFGGYTITREFAPLDTSLYTAIDLGLIDIAPVEMLDGDDVFNAATIDIFVAASGASTMNIFDLVLIPVDERAAQFTRTNTAEYMNHDEILDIDSVVHQKSTIRSLLRRQDDSIRDIWKPITVGPAVFQANTNQRVWFVIFDSSYNAQYAIAHTVQMYHANRYLYARGGR